MEQKLGPVFPQDLRRVLSVTLFGTLQQRERVLKDFTNSDEQAIITESILARGVIMSSNEAEQKLPPGVTIKDRTPNSVTFHFGLPPGVKPREVIETRRPQTLSNKGLYNPSA